MRIQHLRLHYYLSCMSFFPWFAWFSYKNTPECLCVLPHICIPQQVPYSTLLLTVGFDNNRRDTLINILSMSLNVEQVQRITRKARESKRTLPPPHSFCTFQLFSFFFPVLFFQLMSGPESIHTACKREQTRCKSLSLTASVCMLCVSILVVSEGVTGLLLLCTGEACSEYRCGCSHVPRHSSPRAKQVGLILLFIIIFHNSE